MTVWGYTLQRSLSDDNSSPLSVYFCEMSHKVSRRWHHETSQCLDVFLYLLVCSVRVLLVFSFYNPGLWSIAKWCAHAISGLQKGSGLSDRPFLNDPIISKVSSSLQWATAISFTPPATGIKSGIITTVQPVRHLKPLWICCLATNTKT